MSELGLPGTATAEWVLGDIENLNKAERRRLGMLLAGKGPDFLPGWQVVQARTLDEPSAEGLCGPQARLWKFLIAPQREHDLFKRLWLADANRLTRLKVSDLAEHDRLLKKLRARLRQLQHRTNDALAMRYRRDPSKRIEPWHGPRVHGLRRKGDTGEVPT
jgi:hypothetical protein